MSNLKILYLCRYIFSETNFFPKLNSNQSVVWDIFDIFESFIYTQEILQRPMTCLHNTEASFIWNQSVLHRIHSKIIFMREPPLQRSCVVPRGVTTHYLSVVVLRSNSQGATARLLHDVVHGTGLQHENSVMWPTKLLPSVVLQSCLHSIQAVGGTPSWVYFVSPRERP